MKPLLVPAMTRVVCKTWFFYLLMNKERESEKGRKFVKAKKLEKRKNCEKEEKKPK